MSSAHVHRILDASLNRAGEGLRVVEDYIRFVLDDPFLTAQAKSLRHDFAALAAALPASERHAARDTQRDVGTEITTPDESRRDSAWDVCAASLKRAEQSLRSLEEYGKLVDPAFARQVEPLRYRLYTLEKSIDVGRSSRERLESARLCVLVDGGRSEAEFRRLFETLTDAGVGMIQLRDKELDDRELIERARLLVSLTRPQPPAPPGVGIADKNDAEKPPAEPEADSVTQSKILAIINDRADIAAAAHADGVHLGQEDLTVKDARAIVGTRMLVGVSTHNIEQARAAVLDGANYLGAGPTFPSRTKEFDDFAGLNYLREVAAEIRLPTFAIGGITAKNLPEVLAGGIARVAVGAAVTGADKPGCAAREILDMLNASPSACGLAKPQAEITPLHFEPPAPSP
jgi:thiamine-phosphate pyrophosphorylase